MRKEKAILRKAGRKIADYFTAGDIKRRIKGIENGYREYVVEDEKLLNICLDGLKKDYIHELLFASSIAKNILDVSFLGMGIYFNEMPYFLTLIGINEFGRNAYRRILNKALDEDDFALAVARTCEDVKEFFGCDGLGSRNYRGEVD